MVQISVTFLNRGTNFPIDGRLQVFEDASKAPSRRFGRRTNAICEADSLNRTNRYALVQISVTFSNHGTNWRIDGRLQVLEDASQGALAGGGRKRFAKRVKSTVPTTLKQLRPGTNIRNVLESWYKFSDRWAITGLRGRLSRRPRGRTHAIREAG